MSRMLEWLVGQQRSDRRVGDTHLRGELAHVLRARAGCRLIGHRRDPLDEAFAEEPGHRHQHQADGAVAADVVADALLERPVDHRRG